MLIGFASDHAGIALRETLIEYLKSRGYECADYGIRSGNSVQGLVLAKKVAADILEQKIEKGILICGTGVGMSISANKVEGIRAGLCSDVYTARMMVRHNNANVLALGARVVGTELAKLIAEEFLEAHFEGGRHVERIRLMESRWVL